MARGRTTTAVTFGGPLRSEERKTVPPGTVIEVDDEEAEGLFASGVLVDPDAPSEDGDGELSDAERDEIVLAILELEGDEHFGADGKPKTSSLSRVLGRRVSAADRDVAFSTIEDDEEGTGGE